MQNPRNIGFFHLQSESDFAGVEPVAKHRVDIGCDIHDKVVRR
jgi:hypothetical protein